MTNPEFSPERLAEISNQVADLQENVNGVSGRLGSLENQVADLQENVNGVNGNLAALEGKVADLQENINGVNGNLAALEGKVAEMNKVLLAANATLSSLNNQVNHQMDSLNRAVDDLKARMLSMEQRMTTFHLSTVGAFLAALVLMVVNNFLTRGG